ncbi:MAG: hypothetical protein ACXW3L_10590, partial [Limisphaerales bacterium]
GLTNALYTIATLGRDLENNDSVYQFLLGYASNVRQTVRLGAIRSLGLLRDDRALGVLANFSSDPSDAPETTAANRAMEEIRSGRKTGNELQILRTEVLDLKKQNDELKKSFDDLKKQIQAREPKPPAEVKKKKPGLFRRN